MNECCCAVVAPEFLHRRQAGMTMYNVLRGVGGNNETLCINSKHLLAFTEDCRLIVYVDTDKHLRAVKYSLAPLAPPVPAVLAVHMSCFLAQ